MKKWKDGIVLVILMLLVLTQISSASGWTEIPVYGYRWNHLNLTYSLNECDTETYWIQSALEAWTAAFQKYFSITFFTFRPATGGSAGNGIAIPFVCKAQYLTLAEGGQAFPTYDKNMILLYVYIYLSGNLILGTIVRAIAMHEIGHSLGLMHSSDESDIMYSQFLLQDPVVSEADVVSVVSLHLDLYKNLQRVPEFPASALPLLLFLPLCILTIQLQLLRRRNLLGKITG